MAAKGEEKFTNLHFLLNYLTLSPKIVILLAILTCVSYTDKIENSQYAEYEALFHKKDNFLLHDEKQHDEYRSNNFYSYNAVDIKGKTVSLERYRGKVSLVVNVASLCGYTNGHYTDLTQLQTDLAGTGRFSVLAFPCNQFGAQEPWTNEEIERFARTTYNANFPMFSKINVLDDNIPDAWKFLEEKSGSIPNWNFWKYLVDGNGQVIKTWPPWTPVQDISNNIKAAVDVLVESDKAKHVEL